jgi:hypothetical protein
VPECAFHPGVETSVSCPDCGRYLCPKDMVDTPVGYKCRECGLSRTPVLGGVKPRQLVLGAAAGLGAALVLGVGLAFVPCFSFWLSLLYGAAVGEATRRGGGGHRTWQFVAIAAVAALAGTGVGWALGHPNVLATLAAPVVAGVYVYSMRW